MTKEFSQRRKREAANRRIAGALKRNERDSRIRRVIRSAAPTTADDYAAGFNNFDEWLDTTGQNIYKCVDALNGTWKQTT